jgi:hypothetical protein
MWRRQRRHSSIDKSGDAMDEVVQQRSAMETRTLAKKSWTAYVRIALVALIALSIDSAIFHSSTLAGILIFIVISAFAVYCFMEIRSVELYCDDSGVWLCAGVFPWNKGTRGVKWRDIECCFLSVDGKLDFQVL